MKYIMVEVGNPVHAACHVWTKAKWLTPNITYAGLNEVDKELPGEVKFLGSMSEIVLPELPKQITRYQSFLFIVTDAAFKACEAKWETREQRS